MIRNLKALGLALVAVFAMSAMAAAGAQASKVAHLELGTGTVKLDTAADGHQQYVLDGKTVTCTAVDGHATVNAATEPTPTEVTATGIGYTNCHTTALGLSFPTTVTPATGCHYKFTAGTWAGTDATGSVHICETTIDIYTNHTNHTANIMRCQIHVAPQTVGNITYTNATTEAKKAVTIDVTTAAVASTVTDFNTLGCNDEVTGNATYTGHIWVKGTNINKEYTDVEIVGTP